MTSIVCSTLQLLVVLFHSIANSTRANIIPEAGTAFLSIANSTRANIIPEAGTAFLSIANSTRANIIPEAGTAFLIVKVCSQTSDPTFCRDVYNEHLYTPHEDPKGLCQIALAQTIDYVTATRVFIGMADGKERDPRMKSLYGICQMGCESILNVFTDASLAFGRGDYRNVIFSVQGCPKYADKCRIAIGNLVPQLGIQSRQNKVLIEMTLVSAKLIGKI